MKNLDFILTALLAEAELEKKAPVELTTEAKEKLGSDLLFHTLEYSTIGEEGLDF